MIELRQAKQHEAQIGNQLIHEGRLHQRAQGFVQWVDGFPNIDVVAEDIRLQRGYFLVEDQIPIGYMCIDFNGEPVYDDLEGKWITDQKYVVVHRMAIGDAGRGRGMAHEVFRLVKELCIPRDVFSIRIDTHEANKKMQHVLAREGFAYCGMVSYEGDPRLAYELNLKTSV